METRLIVNPLAYVTKMHGSDDLTVGGPVPGRGFNPARLSADDEPDLYSVLSEVLSIGLNNLDVEKDLDTRHAALLEEHGVLVAPDNVPEQPLFSCMLEDVTKNSEIPEDLIVNPTIELRPFDLTKFRSLVVGHLSPHAASVWVNDPDTDVRWGYWLGADDAKLIEALRPGERVGSELDRTKIGQLFAAHILIDRNAGHGSARRKLIDAAVEKFHRDRYSVLENIVEPAQLRALQSYFRRYVEQGFMVFGDSQVPLRFAQNDEPVAAIIHHGLVPMMSRLAGIPVRPTYSFAAVYTGGADLVPHTDRDDCIYSFSLQLDYSPDPENGISPWALFVSPQGDPDTIDPATDPAFYLANGSCLAYMGCELAHYRLPLPVGHRSISLFFHYVPA
jgi:hypothetical protein